jgi:hypothetical protein
MQQFTNMFYYSRQIPICFSGFCRNRLKAEISIAWKGAATRSTVCALLINYTADDVDSPLASSPTRLI